MANACRLTCRRVLRAAALSSGFLLSLAAAEVANAQVAATSPISPLFQSVAQGVGKQIGATGAGWAMSAIGISNSTDEALADLTEIINLLDKIADELNTIHNDFEDLKCETAQGNTALNNAITRIGGLYDRYTDYVIDFHTAQTIPSWEGSLGVKIWLDDIFEPATGVQAQLIAMQNALIQPGGTGVISECTKFIVDQYFQGVGPKKAVFDWTGDEEAPGVYDEVQKLTDFYYLYQTWAAVLLTEAYHVQACLDLESLTPGGDRNCTFVGNDSVTPQSGTTSDTPYNLCADPENSNIAGYCLDAQRRLTNGNNNGAYDGLRTQLIAAGAPYSNALLGKVMAKGSISHDELIYPKSLEDFTNNAMYKGVKIQKSPCAVPLTSADPCGFTVGIYNLIPTDPSDSSKRIKLTYGKVADASGNELFGGYDQWGYGYDAPNNDGSNITTLLANYNGQTAGDTSGTLGKWMASVGFISNMDPSKGPVGNPEKKIILTRETHNAAGRNLAACFMDTNIKRSASAQPWCNQSKTNAANTSKLRKVSGHFNCTSGTTACQGTNYIEASFTKSSTAPDFYVLALEKQQYQTGSSYSWHTHPGWFKGEQGNTKFHHFHWPSLQFKNLPSNWCTIRNKGTHPKDAKNPGGIASMCGKDLEAWLDLELQPPPVASITASADATLDKAHPNRNDGAHLRLSLAARVNLPLRRNFRNARLPKHVVVAFDAAEVQAFLDAGPLDNAKLVLTGTDAIRGGRRHSVKALPMRTEFIEGNGNAAEDHPGYGSGMTWNCASDFDIGDAEKDCERHWPRAIPRMRGQLVFHEDGYIGPVSWDVTKQVKRGVSGWRLLRRRGVIDDLSYYSKDTGAFRFLFPERRGVIDDLSYYSREGAAAEGDLSLAPTLILTRGVHEDRADYDFDEDDE